MPCGQGGRHGPAAACHGGRRPDRIDLDLDLDLDPDPDLDLDLDLDL